MASYWGIVGTRQPSSGQKTFREWGFAFSGLRAPRGELHCFPRGPLASLPPALMQGKSNNFDRALEAGRPSARTDLSFSL